MRPGGAPPDDRDDFTADPEELIPQQARRPGDRYVVVSRSPGTGLRRGAHGMLVATPEADLPPPGLQRQLVLAKRVLIGRPLATVELEAERLQVRRALPILSSDALSSVAYGPEAGLAVLALAGVGAAFAFEVPIAIAIAALMVLVVLSYRQIVVTRQVDGGSYVVARDYLGAWPAMVAAAALLVDYVLTVAVSTSSGADALASAFPSLAAVRLPIALALVGLLCLGNLRGVREAGAIFFAPTYAFIVAITALIVVGLVRGLSGAAHHPGVYPVAAHSSTEALGPLLILTAFASGCSSMTGIEAVANSVRSFREPAGRNAGRALLILGGLLVFLFLGVTFVDWVFGTVPKPGGNPTVLAQLAAHTFIGPGRWFFFVLQLSTMAVLVLAANASFNGFPRLCAFLARDDRLPHRFRAFGNRLVYSSAIVFLTAVSLLLTAVFNANTDRLINLYAVGVFTAFTLAQAALVRYGLKQRDQGWRRRLAINGLGAAATLVVDLVVIVVKFRLGAWVVLVLVPLLLLMFWGIERHYRIVSAAKFKFPAGQAEVAPADTLVPLWSPDRASGKALAYAASLRLPVLVLDLTAAGLDSGWISRALSQDLPAEEASPYFDVRRGDRRRRAQAIRGAIADLRGPTRARTVTVVVPDVVVGRGLRGIARQVPSLRVKLALLRQPGVVVSSAPAAQGQDAETTPSRTRIAVVPVAGLDSLALRAIAYAQQISDRVVAVHVATGQSETFPGESESASADAAAHPGAAAGEEARELESNWDSWVGANLRADPALPQPLLRVVVSPYRSVVQPLLRYLDALRQRNPEAAVTVVLPELVPRHFWNQLLHNHRAFQVKTELLRRHEFAVADVTLDLSAFGS